MMLDDKNSNSDGVDQPTAEEQLDEARHKLQRLAADFDNFRKRTHREKEDLQVRALKRFLLTLLPVVDDFERAMAHLETADEGVAADGPQGTALHGLRMVAGGLQQVLALEGVRRFVSQGERFTPRRHEAVDHVYHDEIPSGFVIREVMPGYEYGDDVLRPSRVVVSKGRESDHILFEFDIEEEESTEPNLAVPNGLDDETP